MSIRSMSALAVQRDEIKPHKAKKAAQSAQPETVPQSWSDVIISAIPSEVLAVYTGIVGVIIATIKAGESDQFWLRWGLYAAGAVFVMFWLAASYFRNRTAKTRPFP